MLTLMADVGLNSIDPKYDPDGNRVWRNVGYSTVRKFIVDIVGDLPVILVELNASDDSIVKSYVYANGQILMQQSGLPSNRYFYLHDRLGSIRQIVSYSGSVVKYYTYNPFGETLESGGTLDNSFLFTGQYYDSEIAEYYLRARQYDPHIARFTARDLVFGQFEEPLTLHRYLYCRNNPVNMVDPQGLWTFHIQGSVSATMIGSFVVQAGIVIDDNGNVGWMVTRSRLNIPGGYDDWVGFGTPSVSAGIAIGGTNADTIFDLQGRGLSIGGSVKLPMLGMVTGDFLTGNQRNGNPYYGFEITPGFLLSPLLCEVHVQQTETTVSPWNWNYRNSFENLKNSLEESIFETKTLGEAYMVFFAMGLMDRYD